MDREWIKSAVIGMVRTCLFCFFFKKKDVEIVNMLTALRIEHRFEIQERGQMLK